MLSRVHTSRYLKLALLGILLVSAACNKKVSSNNSSSGTPPAVAPLQPIAPLSANDVSWLFPAPTQAADFANLIAVRDVTTPNPQDPTQARSYMAGFGFPTIPHDRQRRAGQRRRHQRPNQSSR